MQKETAKRVTSLMLEVCKKLEESLEIVTTAGQEEEHDRRDAMEFRAAIGKIMGHIFVDVLHPIYQRNPELEPEELRSQRR